MTRTRMLLLGGAIAAVSLAVTTCSSEPQATADTPIETDLPRIVAAGDFHGDYDAFSAVITGAGLVDEGGGWAAGDTIFIQVGDLPDRGPDTRRIISELRELQTEAAEDGGQVIVLAGNHEALLMRGDYRYLHPGEIEAYRTEESDAERDQVWTENRDAILASGRQRNPDRSEEEIRAAWEEQTPLGLVELAEAWSPEGEVGDWVDELPSVVILGDSLFVHGGLSALYADYTVEDINAAGAAALTAQSRDGSAIINDPSGPQWYRGLHREPGAISHFAGLGPLTIEEELDMVLEAFDVDRIIVGHTPSVEGIVSAHDDRVIRIDTGMSAAYGGVISWLTIDDGVITAFNEGEATVIDSGKDAL